MKNALTGKIGLVTGGSRGIGRAAALALAKAGAAVAVNFQHREAEAQAVCREIEGIGRRALGVKADVSEAAAVARLVEAVEKGLGGIDILVNNAGISRPQPLAEITEQDWDDVLTVNLKSMFLGRWTGRAGLGICRKQRFLPNYNLQTALQSSSHSDMVN